MSRCETEASYLYWCSASRSEGSLRLRTHYSHSDQNCQRVPVRTPPRSVVYCFRTVYVMLTVFLSGFREDLERATISGDWKQVHDFYLTTFESFLELNAAFKVRRCSFKCLLTIQCLICVFVLFLIAFILLHCEPILTAADCESVHFAIVKFNNSRL